MLVTRLDVTDEAFIAAAISAALERFGGIDMLINNAGFGAYGPLEVTAMEVIRRQFDTNVIGLLAVSKAVLPVLRQRWGRCDRQHLLDRGADDLPPGVLVSRQPIGGRGPQRSVGL